ncbi:MAG TPA: sugar phosphate nucleotidyltransferase [Planctomycetota bacterium]|nr:sugar phosphate nucleotidyltransferase [Planctomycetota bacterium]
MEGLITLLLAGGRGMRLRPLTRRLAKPAVPFAGRRLIDFTLENAARSSLGRVLVLTQHLASTVGEHVRTRWEGRADILSSHAAGQRYGGTADAVRIALRHVGDGDRVLVLPCHHIGITDYRWLVATHVMADADATMPVARVTVDEAPGLDVFEAGPSGLVRRHLQRPAAPPVAPLASVGICLFERRALEAALAENEDAMDLERDLLPRMVEGGARIAVRPFPGPRRGITDIDDYFEAHAAYRTNGCYVWPRAKVAPDARVEDSILLDGAEVGERACLRRTIVDEGVRVPAGARIGFDPEEDRALGYVTKGGVTVLTSAASAAPVMA